MVEQVERFHAELMSDSLRDLGRLGDREVHILEARSDQRISPQVTEVEDVCTSSDNPGVHTSCLQASAAHRHWDREYRRGIASGRRTGIANDRGREPLHIAGLRTADDDRRSY